MNRLRTSYLVAFFVLLTLAPATCVSAKDTWVSVRTKNFFLIGNASEKDVKQVGARLEQFREVFTHLFPKMNFTSPVPTTVVVFKSDSSYRPFKPGANTAGFFQPGPDVNYIALSTEVPEGQDPFEIIFHEYTHLLVNNTIANAPTWFNEGLAEYYSTFTITNDQKIELGKPIGNHVFLLRQNKMVPLRTLFQVDHKSPYYNESNKQSIFYAQSWALMHYLIIGKEGRLQQMGDFLEKLNANVPMEQAFQQAFQMTFEAMEKELRKYVQQDRYNVVRGHFERKLELDTAMPAVPLSEAEAQAYLGDLLLHSNRVDCEVYLQKALALDPNLAMAHASLGMARFRAGKTDEARKSLERAAASSQNYLIHYYYAYTLSRTNPEDSQALTGYSPETAAKIREEAQKAIALRPDFPESYNLLAFVSLVTGTQLDESIAMMKHALQNSPGRNDFNYMLAQLYVRNSDYKAARQLLEQLANSNADESIKQHAQLLLTQVSQIEAQKTRFEQARRATGANRAPTLNAGIEVSTSSGPLQQTPSDPSSYLREVLRQPATGETQLQGFLVRIECDQKGIVFVINTGTSVLRLRTTSFDQVEITTYSPDVKGDISCGVRKPENQVVVCYLPNADKRVKADGILKSVEFVPKDFKLKP